MGKAVEADIVIVGAGMVGMTLACLIAPSGLNIKVLESRPLNLDDATELEKQQREQGFDPRVSALTAASQQVLTVAGAWPLMQQMRVSPYTAMDVWDGEGTGNIQFNSADLHEPYLGHIVENRVTLAALYKASLAWENIQVLGDAQLVSLSEPLNDADGHSVRTLVLADGKQLETPLVIAADGALSRTRQLAGISMWEWDYGHHAIVTTVQSEQHNQATCWQRFTEDGPVALLPLQEIPGESSAKFSSIVWSTSPDHAKELMALDDVQFCRQLENAVEGRLGAFQWSDRRFVFPLRQRHAMQYVKPGFAAIGDAAHTIHPLAGQGVNLGLMDAAALAEVIIKAVVANEAWGCEFILRRFQRMRRGENLQMAATMQGFKQLFDSTLPVARLLRNVGMGLMNRTPLIKNHLVQQAMGLSGDLPEMARRPIKE
ncbi:MAG: FAD-dependent monooxygenase [Amphritea sp.]